MYKLLEQRLADLLRRGHTDLLTAGRIGLEKESLRVNREGTISQRPHPRALGSPLTNPYITTDYSEALLELITPPLQGPAAALQWLQELQQFVYREIDDELLWATSMPCVIAGETSIPIAEYGRSNLGLMKTVYRRGLGHRYGRVMQVIAGVHFNYSFSDEFWDAHQTCEGDSRPARDFIADRYFALIRNLQRFGWLIPYLFGASPAICKSFIGAKAGKLEEFDAGTYYEPYATSLRMGDIGYQNNKENEIGVKACYDSVAEYVDALTYAIETSYPGYERIGVKVDGEYRQLNSNILQIENEYYSTVRPKQLLEGNEKPSLALKRRGVRYFELRSLDVNAFHPLGIDLPQLHFLEVLSLFCLLHDSPKISPWERAEIDNNEMLAAHRGREPGLLLKRNGEQLSLQVWARELLTAMVPLAEAMDASVEGSPYAEALAAQAAAVEDPDLTPSARMLALMRENGEGFHQVASRMSQSHQHYFRHLPQATERMAFFEAAASESLAAQARIEAADELSFDEFLARYLAQH